MKFQHWDTEYPQLLNAGLKLEEYVDLDKEDSG